jgi:1-phosphofructokinase
VDPSHLLGAGDTYMAAMIYHSRKYGTDLLERAKFGMAAALAKTKYLFKKSPTIQEVEESLPKIQTKQIKG